MIVSRIIETPVGDPAQALREFLTAWWSEYNLEGLLAPVESSGPDPAITRVIENPSGLDRVNPFIPYMQGNAARKASNYLEENPAKRLAVILRPCELRAFRSLLNRRPEIRGNQPIVIGVDCLGTFSSDEYRRQLEMSEGKEITESVLANAASGGLKPQNFRTACQVCDWPAPRKADLTIGLIGVDSHAQLLLIARDEETDEALELARVSPVMAREYLVSHRETLVGALADKRKARLHRMLQEVQGTCRFDELGCLLAWLANCNLCGKCLNACPLYQGELDALIGVQDNRPALSTLVALGRWLSECGGCGMCEASCSQGVPLFLLITALSHRIRHEMDYTGDVHVLPTLN